MGKVLDDSRASAVDKKVCSKACLRRKWKHLLVLLFFAVLIVYLIVDTVTKPCTVVEAEDDRVFRLFCEDVLELLNGSIVDEGMFVCSRPNATNPEWRPCISEVDSPVCIQDASCVQLGLSVFIDWIENNVLAGFFATSFVYAIASILLIPGSVLTIGSGAAFGTALGLGIGVIVGALSVWLGASAGAMISFLLGKYLLRDFTQLLINKYKVIRAIDSSLADEGFKITLLLRFSPVVPFSAFNYVMGATSCAFRNYSLATMIGIFPGTLAYVFIGAAVASAATGMSSNDSSMSLSNENCNTPGADVVTIIVLVVGVIATFVAVVIIGKYSRKAFQKYVNEEGGGRVHVATEQDQQAQELANGKNTDVTQA